MVVLTPILCYPTDSPWMTSAAAAIDDRRYKNHLVLGIGKLLPGIVSAHLNKSYVLVAANDAIIGSSAGRYSPSDCQRPGVLNKNLVEGIILLYGYSFNFVVGTASIKKVSETAKTLGAAGFVLAVENVTPGTKFDHVPTCVPGILITDVKRSLFTFHQKMSPPTSRLPDFPCSRMIKIWD